MSKIYLSKEIQLLLEKVEALIKLELEAKGEYEEGYTYTITIKIH